MIHPFNQIDLSLIRKIIKLFIWLTIIVLIMLCSIFITGPNPIEFFNLANSISAENANSITSGWTEVQKKSISFFAGFDFLWGFLWTNLLAFLFIYLKKIKQISTSSKYDILAYFCWILLLLDIPENLSYYGMMLFKPVDPLPLIFFIIMYIRWIGGLGFLFYIIMTNRTSKKSLN